MGDYRSKSYADGRMQKESYYGYKPNPNPHVRSQSVSFQDSYAYGPPQSNESYGYKPNSNPNYFRSQSVSYDSSYAYRPPQPNESYGYKPSSKPNNFRSQSVSYDSSSAHGPPQSNQIVPVKDLKLKKAKSTAGYASKSWCLSDPEFQRKKRVASYKVYSVEGKVKGSLKKSFKWIKDRCTLVVNGRW